MSTATQMKESELLWQLPILEALPDTIQKMIRRLPTGLLQDLEEIRIRENRPLMVHSHGRDYFVSKDGGAGSYQAAAYQVTADDTHKILQLISDYSIYAFDEEIRNGYLTLRGGHRVGLTGKTVLENGQIRTMKYIKSFNIRISREIIGAADKIMPFLLSGRNICHTLILSPPQMGKTTLLRDIARKISDGFPGFQGMKVGIVDERSEIAGCWHGLPQKKIGYQTDVLDGCPKAAGIMMLIRSMSPRVILTDEIGRAEDAAAIQEALNAGIRIITSAHAADIQDALARPFLSHLLGSRIFERVAVLGDSLGVGTLEKIYNADFSTQLLSQPIR